MQLAEYEAYVVRLESKADQSHTGFRLRVVGLVILGYGLAFLILLSMLVVAALLVLGRMIFAGVRMLTLGWHFARGICKGLWIKIEKSENAELSPEKIRPLIDLVDEVCVQLKAPKIHTVFIGDDCNAWAGQRPTFGPFGRFRREVSLGLPLLAAFTLEELRDVVAHEIGHIHHGHARFALRVTQIVRAWNAALEEIKKSRIRASVVYSLFNWYTPKLRGAEFVLSRIAEREANRAEARVAGVPVVVQSHVDLAIYSKLWPEALTDCWRAAYSGAELPADILLQACERVRQPASEERMRELLKTRLDQPHDPFSTHPTTGQILRELGVEPSIENVLSIAELPGADRLSAGEALFGDRFGDVVREVSVKWSARMQKRWQESREKHQKGQLELDSLLANARQIPPTPEQCVELGEKLLGVARYQEALDWIEPVKEFSQRARLIYGLVLRGLKDPGWIPWVEKASQDVRYRQTGGKVLVEYYTSVGDRTQVQRMVDSMNELRAADAKIEHQMRQLTTYWQHGPCPWTQEQIKGVVEQLAKLRIVKRAYLVGRTNGESRFDNCCLVVEYGFGVRSPKELTRKISKFSYPGRCFILCPSKAPEFITMVPGALVYDRNQLRKRHTVRT